MIPREDSSEDVANVIMVMARRSEHGGEVEVFVIRDKTKSLNGVSRISFPGGGMKPSETPLGAVIRETREETGIVPVMQLTTSPLRPPWSLGRFPVYAYTTERFVGSPTLAPEIEWGGWMRVRDLLTMEDEFVRNHWLILCTFAHREGINPAPT